MVQLAELVIYQRLVRRLVRERMNNYDMGTVLDSVLYILDSAYAAAFTS